MVDCGQQEGERLGSGRKRKAGGVRREIRAGKGGMGTSSSERRLDDKRR